MQLVHRNGDVCPPKHHNNVEFRRLMQVVGLSQSQLAARIDTHVNTVSRWSTDQNEPPGAVLAYLRLLARVRALDA